MLKRRVVVTGMGIVSPIGNSVPEFWEGLSAGRNGIAPITHFDTSDHKATLAGEVKNLDLDQHFERKELNMLDRFSALGLIAAREAVDSSGILDSDFDPNNIGVITGSGIGGITVFSQQVERMLKSPRRVSPYFIPAMISDIIAGHISIRFGFKGPNYGLVSACATTTHTIGDATRMIQYGDADAAIAGGSEASIAPIAIAGFANMKAITKNSDPETASRPFDLNRDGFVLGEGAGFLMLEALEHAQARDADILAEIVGYGATGDAYHLTAPAPDHEGAGRAMAKAVKDAGIRLDQVDYINAHGTSTPHNDKNEAIAVKKLFGEHVSHLKISSTKSMTGHLLGSAGAVEAAASILTIRNSLIPPTIHYKTPDPQCDLDFVPNTAQAHDVHYAMSNTFGFGGHNAVLIIKKWIA